MIEYGEHIQFYKRIKERRGKKTPLDFKPVDDAITSWLIDAYQFLSPLRIEKESLAGITKGFVPVSEVVAYAKAFPILISLDEFTNVIRQLDISFLEHLKKKREEDNHNRKK